MVDIRICDCGGLAYKCELYGHLPESVGHYRQRTPSPPLTVVWSGRGELLDNRQERADDRIYAMPTYDIDDGEVADVRPRRKYTRTGKHAGKCSRTNPLAPQYIPRKTASDGVTETTSNG